MKTLNLTVTFNRTNSLLLSALAWLRHQFALLFALLATPTIDQSSFQTLGLTGNDSLRDIVEAQWGNDRDKKYILQLPFRNIHVLPAHFLSDYGWKHDHEISSNIDLRERILGRWTLLGSMTPNEPGDRTHSAIAFIKDFMTKNMASYFGSVHEEIEYALNEQVEPCSDWHPHSAYWLAIDLNLRIFERVFVDLDLCRNKDWCWVERAGNKQTDSYALTLGLIQLNIAGIQSTGMVVMQALFDLAGRPEYVQPLRDEFEAVIAEHGRAVLSPRMLGSLVKMDSFLKESQRHVAQNILSVYRKVMSPLTLQDGTVISKGSYVAVPSIDPEAKPHTLTRRFDGLKWARLRESPDAAQKFTTVASGVDSLEFGYGIHACPGRFFAMNVVKATIVAILRRYDLRLPSSEKVPRPQYNRLLVLIPPKAQAVEFRRRGKN